MADGPDVAAALAGSRAMPFWLDRPDRPAPHPPLRGEHRTDLLVVGAGFSGLWTALLAKQADPDRDVLLIEAGRVAGAATGRNGGFCAASLTHGRAQGEALFPDEIDRLDDLGRRNLDAIARTVREFGIGCDLERTGELDVATEPYQIEPLRSASGEFLDTAAVRAELDSPTYLAGSWDRTGVALLDPARLAWGLARVAADLGVRIAEDTRLAGLRQEGAGVLARTDGATVRARRVALGTGAAVSPLRRLRLFTVPVWDYVLVTEPLSTEQLSSIGWRHRQGVGDSANQFHYYRLTADNRILWGGYDAVYHFGRSTRAAHEDRTATFRLLARQFFDTFPPLAGLRFTHRWGGAIDTCTRFCPFFGTALSGRVAYALGYTGLGVGATRFGAEVMLDLLDDRETERRDLALVRSRPLPFPPEPFAWAGIQATRRSLAAADRNAGRRNLWLRTLDRAGVGFDS